MLLSRQAKYTPSPILILLVLMTVGFQTGCETSSSRPSPGDANPLRASSKDSFSRQQLSAAAFAFGHWEENSRTEAVSYRVDPYDRRLPPRFRQRLQAMLPKLAENADEQPWTFAFDKVVFPEGYWAYVTYRESDPFHAIEYTDVLRWEDDQWVLMHHFVVAEGIMDSVMIDFQWSMYRETHIADRSMLDSELPTED